MTNSQQSEYCLNNRTSSQTPGFQTCVGHVSVCTKNFAAQPSMAEQPGFPIGKWVGCPINSSNCSLKFMKTKYSIP